MWFEPGGEGKFKEKLGLEVSVPCVVEPFSAGFVEALAK